jgi:hypothetical protein
VFLKLFDNESFDLKGCKPDNMSLYEFFSRSSAPEAANGREVWNRFFSDVPTEFQERLKDRIQANKVEASIAAIYELFLYSLFRALGMSVVCHPDPPANVKPNKNDTPDFLVTTKQNEQFLVEATCLLPDSARSKSDSRKHRLQELIKKKVKSDSVEVNATYWAEIDTEPDYMAIVKKVSEYVRAWENLVAAGQEIEGDYVVIRVKESFLKLKPHRRKPSTLGKPLIPGCWMGCFLDEEHQRFKKKLNKKAAKDYKNWGLPYIIAVNDCNYPPLEEVQILDAIFGDTLVHFYPENDQVRDVEIVRDTNGFWGQRESPLNTRVAGVIITQKITYDSLPGTPPTIWVNPFADKKCPLTNCEYFTRMLPDSPSSCYREIKGNTYSDLLGLWPGWPNQQLQDAG